MCIRRGRAGADKNDASFLFDSGSAMRGCGVHAAHAEGKHEAGKWLKGEAHSWVFVCADGGIGVGPVSRWFISCWGLGF